MKKRLLRAGASNKDYLKDKVCKGGAFQMLVNGHKVAVAAIL